MKPNVPFEGLRFYSLINFTHEDWQRHTWKGHKLVAESLVVLLFTAFRSTAISPYNGPVAGVCEVIPSKRLFGAGNEAT